MSAAILVGKIPTFAKGSGYGSGYGDGYGYGDGSGDGSGYGSGDGSGSAKYWLACIKYFAERWSAAQRARFDALNAAGAKIAFWRSDETGRPCNGGVGAPVTPGTVQKIPGPLELCGPGALHATAIPPKWNGARVWVVALIGKVIGDEEKYGALEREIIGECE